MARKRNFKRMLIVADFQSGHRAGLTPPAYQWKEGKWAEIQETGWNFYAKAVKKWKPYDLVLANGDLVDGEGSRSGGVERMRNLDEQIRIAADCLKIAECRKVRMTMGTWYHVQTLEGRVASDLCAAGFDARLKFWQFLRINGREIQARHHTGNSSIAHGEATPLLRAKADNMRWAELNVQSRADAIIRSHVHKYLRVYQDHVWSVTTPSLQMLGDIYGSTRCSGVVHFGILVLDITDSGEMIWHDEKGSEIMEAEVQMESSEVI